MLSLGLLRGIAAFTAGVVIFRLHRQGWFARLPLLSPELLLTLWLCIAVGAHLYGHRRPSTGSR